MAKYKTFLEDENFIFVLNNMIYPKRKRFKKHRKVKFTKTLSIKRRFIERNPTFAVELKQVT
jgi:predicted AAA+ superfamily ATPase